MDWDFSIERNRGMLLPHIAGLFALIGLVEGGMVERVSRPVYRRALMVLKSAESAVRRLIIVMARDMKVEPRPKRPMPKGLVRSRKGTFQGKNHGNGKGQGQKPRRPSFNLFDPERRSDCRPGSSPPAAARRPRTPHPCLRLRSADSGVPSGLGLRPQRPLRSRLKSSRTSTVSAKRLCRRLFAIMYALTHMEREAERYARWWAQPVEERRPRRERALRFGWPPGWRIKPTHEVHEILKECQWLFHSLPEPDTS